MVKFLLPAILLCYAATARATNWYTFYDDDLCSVGGGESVDGSNDGCLTESGRLSVGSHGTDTLFYPVLIAYSDDNCQVELGCNSAYVGASGADTCDNFNTESYEYAQGALSFKFVSGDPPECPNDCAGYCPGGESPSKRALEARAQKLARQQSTQHGNLSTPVGRDY